MIAPRPIPGTRWRWTLLSPALACVPAQALAHASRTPTPDDIWSVWTLSPLPAVALLVVSWLYARGIGVIWRAGGRGRGIHRWQAGCFAAGMLALAIAILSPLDTLGDALLAAHMTQHMLFLVVAPPLLVLGAPLAPLLLALPRGWRVRLVRGWRRSGPVQPIWHALNHPALAWGIAALVLWGWHVPWAYEAAIRYPFVHDIEHAMFLGSSLLFWWTVIQPVGRRRKQTYGTSLVLLFTTALQGSALGVLMTFSSILWYPVYDGRTAPWHVTAIQDQHIAGAVMWVPGGIVYLLGILLVLGTWLGQDERQSAHSLAATGQQKGVEQWVGS
ncbi:MAG TPA: cytochrome c oxidase assembly protein [Thermomicrobiales bacterium]|nr:cytochrome c oxidase assembly protein [Thermomicrobiales bacterium]